MPVALIMEKVIVVPGVQHGLQKQPDNLEVSHVAETAVGGVNASADNPKPAIRHLLAEQVILGIQRLLVKTTEFLEDTSLEQHEHAGAEGAHHHRPILGDIVAQIKNV